MAGASARSRLEAATARRRRGASDGRWSTGSQRRGLGLMKSAWTRKKRSLTALNARMNGLCYATLAGEEAALGRMPWASGIAECRTGASLAAVQVSPSL